jgi:hypothetical protein
VAATDVLAGSAGYSFGTYSFDDTYTQENNGTDKTYTLSNTGLSYAALLVGIPTTSAVQLGAPSSIRTPYYAFYAADTWRVTPKLTLNPGIRFEYEFGPSEKNNAQIVGWDSTASLPIAGPANAAYAATLAAATPAEKAILPTSLTIQGGPIYAGVNGAPTRQFANNYRFLPRLAASYQITQKTVLRAGYGMFFDTINAHEEGGSPHPSAANIGGINQWGESNSLLTRVDITRPRVSLPRPHTAPTLLRARLLSAIHFLPPPMGVDSIRRSGMLRDQCITLDPVSRPMTTTWCLPALSAGMWGCSTNLGHQLLLK